MTSIGRLLESESGAKDSEPEMATVVQNRQRPKFGAFLAVFGGFLVHLTLGTIYTFGNMTPYFTSYIRAYSKPNDIHYTTSIWIYALSVCGQGAAMFLGGFINNYLGARWTTLIGGWTASLGIFLTSITIKWSFYASLLSYGLLFGAGIGIAYAPPLACAMKWLPNHKGLVNGIVVAGFGGGAFVFDQIQTAFINPDNLSPDLTVASEKYFSPKKAADLLARVPKCFLLMGGCYTGLQLIGSLLLRDPPEPSEECGPLISHESERDEVHEDSANIQRLSFEVESLHPKEMLKRKAFYLLWFMFLFNGQGIVFISSLYKSFGQIYPSLNNDQFLALVGAFSSVFNSGGRIMWGRLADKFSFRTAMLILCASMISFMLTLIATPVGGKAMFFIWICGIFLSFSGNFVLFPTAIAKSFGPRYVAVNFGILFTSQAVTGPLGAILATNLKDAIGYYGMFCLVSGFTFLSMILAFFFDVKKQDGSDI